MLAPTVPLLLASPSQSPLIAQLLTVIFPLSLTLPASPRLRSDHPSSKKTQKDLSGSDTDMGKMDYSGDFINKIGENCIRV